MLVAFSYVVPTIMCVCVCVCVCVCLFKRGLDEGLGEGRDFSLGTCDDHVPL
jgi:hypothetical protein